MLSPSLLAFFKETGQRDYFEKVFINLIPSSETTLYILNAHLITEELVYKLIQKSLQNPCTLKSADLSYHKKCLRLKALYGDDLAVWLYPALTQLGALRNKCAHALDHPRLDEAISLFIDAAYDRSPDNEALLIKSRGKGYSPKANRDEEQLVQKHNDLVFRLPMGCERIIEHLLRKWLSL